VNKFFNCKVIGREPKIEQVPSGHFCGTVTSDFDGVTPA
jgi:hypothetical protein